MMVRRVFVLMFALVLALVTPAGAQDPLSGFRRFTSSQSAAKGGWDFLRG